MMKRGDKLILIALLLAAAVVLILALVSLDGCSESRSSAGPETSAPQTATVDLLAGK